MSHTAVKTLDRGFNMSVLISETKYRRTYAVLHTSPSFGLAPIPGSLRARQAVGPCSAFVLYSHDAVSDISSKQSHQILG